MKRLILSFTLILCSFLLFAQEPVVSESLRPSVRRGGDVPFSNRYNGTFRGSMTFIANNILSEPPTYEPYNGSGFNHNINLSYIDIDGDPSTFSSSRATLYLPTCSKVVFAGLYWAGIYPYDKWSDEKYGVNTRDDNFNEIKFKLPGGNYIDLVADKTDLTKRELIYDNGDKTEMPYVCFKDVTNLVASLNNPSGDYYAANIKATLGKDQVGSRLGSSAGWSLVIAYENESESSKKIYVFDGFSTIRKLDGSRVDVNISGFQTVPTGPVRTTLLVGALEGDKSIDGDDFQIRKHNTSKFFKISTGYGNPFKNFFNSTVTRNDWNETNRYPASPNTLGFDADIFALNNNGNIVLNNNQTNTTLRFTTNGDSYYPFLLGMAVEIIEPKVQLIKTIDTGVIGTSPPEYVPLGSELWYNISFQNVGTDNAKDTQIVDFLPKNVDLAELSLELPSGITSSDYIYYPPSVSNEFRGVLVINVPDDMVKEGGKKHNIRFRVKVAASCNDLRDVCSNIIVNQAFANYSSDLGGTPRVENDPSVAGLDACNFGIEGASNFLADTRGCTYERDEILCGTSITLTAGSGFSYYEWRKEPSQTVIGTESSLVVSELGTYTVSKVTNWGCINTTETITVKPYNNEPNPLIPFVDKMETCSNDGSDLAEIYLCGNSSSRVVNLPLVQKLEPQ
ncbi:MAG: hypothetical protein ACK5H1_05660 [Tenacibaculum sp.]